MGANRDFENAAAWPGLLSTRLSLFGRRHNIAPFALLAPVFVFLALVLVLPIALMAELSLYQRGEAGTIIKVMSLSNYITFLKEPVYLKVLGNSALIGALVCVITVGLSIIPATVLGLTRSRVKNILFILILIPFWTSFIVRTYAWIVLLGTNGVLNGMLRTLGLTEAPISMLFSRQTVILGLVHAMIPFALVPIYASIERIDDSFLEAAATLGARPWAIFVEIIIPMSMPGIWAAGILVFIEAMGAFITPQLLGSASDMMIAQLVQERFIGSFDWPFGSAVAVIYLLFTGAAFAALFAGRQAIAGGAR
jgi:spermidine/putrescine transport system permease protein